MLDCSWSFILHVENNNSKAAGICNVGWCFISTRDVFFLVNCVLRIRSDVSLAFWPITAHGKWKLDRNVSHYCKTTFFSSVNRRQRQRFNFLFISPNYQLSILNDKRPKPIKMRKNLIFYTYIYVLFNTNP